jgi:hypothetical protein
MDIRSARAEITHLAAAEVMQRWRQLSPVPLRTVSGDKLAMALSFYSPDHPAFNVPFDQQYVWQIRPRRYYAVDGRPCVCPMKRHAASG